MINHRTCARCLIGVLLVAMCGCARQVETLPSAGTVMPSALRGDFVDDYGISYSISYSEWLQRPRARYHIAHVDTAGGYLLAKNDVANPGEGGLWTRIDWVMLDNMAPYAWAFCLSVYDAPTRAAAQAVTIARRDVPRTGCNGHPFSRMRR